MTSGIALERCKRFFAGDYATAVDASLRAQQLLWTSPSQFETAEFRFYGALSHAAAWDSASSDQRQHHFEALTAHHRQLEIWAEHCPENFENRTALVGAEIARNRRSRTRCRTSLRAHYPLGTHARQTSMGSNPSWSFRPRGQRVVAAKWYAILEHTPHTCSRVNVSLAVGCNR